MFRQSALKSATVCLLVAAAVVYAVTGSYFGRELLIETAVLAILAISLDLVAGYGGMISLCHGAISGIGAYGFAIITAQYGLAAPLAMVVGISAATVYATAVGAAVARTRGIFYIMATLALGQMAYIYLFESPLFGGDDGMSGARRLDLSAVGVDLDDSMQFALFTVACAGFAYAVAAFGLSTGFGRALVGVRSNEERMRALGLPVRAYKTSAFAVSGALAGLGGVLAAQHTMFVSPGLLEWTVSGELLVVVILGGIGTLVGPVVGATLLVFLKHEVSRFTDHWHIVVGLVLIVAVVAGGRGVYGSLEHALERRARRRRLAASSLAAAPREEVADA